MMINLEEYLLRLNSITTQYDYTRHAIMGFIATTDPASYTAATGPKRNWTINALLYTTSPEFVAAIQNAFESYKGNFPEDKKELENRLAQNEIILLVAVFEDQMKSIHREILRQNPRLLNTDKELSLGRLITFGEKRIIEEEIERAVQLLDRQSLKEKAKAFEKLGFRWEVEIEKIDHIIRLRNIILHEDMNKEVTGLELVQTRIQVISLPAQLCWLGASIYPQGFYMSPELVAQRNKIGEDRKTDACKKPQSQ